MRTTSGNVDPTTYYHITDAQFSTMAMLQGAVLQERVEFDAYGRARHYWASDVDGDGAVTQGDQNAITTAANANPQLQIGATGYNVAMDINRDGVIDLLDVFAFVAQANRPALAAGQISDPAGPDNLIGYDGYVFNMENMLYTVRFRHYDPQLGRWIERDPLEYVDGMSLFQYVKSNPIISLDPNGMQSQKTPLDQYYNGHTKFNKFEKFLWRKLGAVQKICMRNAFVVSIAAVSGPEFNGTRHNGPGDAVRHCIFSCLMTRCIGIIEAKKWGDAHEFSTTDQDELDMDLHNNQVGRDSSGIREIVWKFKRFGRDYMCVPIGLDDPESKVSCVKQCKKALLSGQLKTLPKERWN